MCGGILLTRVGRGDTIVEVILAFALFTLIAVGALAIMNRGANMADRSLELTLVREQIDAQADILRYARDTKATAWQDIKSNLGTAASATAELTACPDASQLPDAAFSVNLATDGSVSRTPLKNADSIFSTTPTSSNFAFRGAPTVAGMWTVPVEVEGNPGTYDMYIRACWYPPGSSSPEVLGTIVRLYDQPVVVSPLPPAPPVVGNVISQVDVGNYHVCANSLAGEGYCWGKNDFGALGNGTNNNAGAPFGVSSTGALAGKTIVGTSAGYNHTCVIDSDGLVYCWGYNSQGQLGNGATGTTNNPNPTAVVTTGPMAGRKVININGGDAHTCALTQDGNVYCWGGNDYGQLGIGGVLSSFVPTEIQMTGAIAGKNLVDVSAGYAHTCALASDGTAYCWGFNGHGQLGNGSNFDSDVPVAVSGGLRFTQISAGDEHTCGVAFDDRVYCWGYNQQGQVGNGTLFDTNAPTAVIDSGVLSGLSVSKVAAGYRHTCAIANGDVYCWGNNDAGQLGNGEVFVTHTTPVAVINTGAMAGKRMSDIATGRYSSCAVGRVTDGGEVYCWGKNDDGQLGDNRRPVDSSVPSLVVFP